MRRIAFHFFLPELVKTVFLCLMETPRVYIIETISHSAPLSTSIVTLLSKAFVYAYFLILFTFWLRKVSPLLKWKFNSTPKPMSKGLIYTLVTNGLRHFFFSCLFFVGVHSLTSISQTVASETSNTKFSFFHTLSPRFVLPTISFGDYLSIDIATFLCKGIFAFVNVVFQKEFSIWEYAISSVMAVFIFIFLSITSLSVLYPSRLTGTLEPAILNSLLPKLNAYFCWIILPSIVIFNYIPLCGGSIDSIEIAIYTYFVLALIGAPAYIILSSIETAGGFCALSGASSLLQLLHSIMYGLVYAFGYKALYVLNSIINSYFDSDVAPFNPLADDFSGSLITRFSFLKFN